MLSQEEIDALVEELIQDFGSEYTDFIEAEKEEQI